ncbi:DUF4867 family protein [Paenibacillus macerans]|uniref:DUF4867 family protein n=1 Tax=Paenibacillus macerans TaxID=44252 RepID=UPI002040E596|nr:DUF4867 family protein [Paenibacillus macerans]MCM3698082.1 DUF4867 family protein [Paenibacillus macerans]
MSLEQLNSINKPLVIHDILSEAFRPFGKVWTSIHADELIAYALEHIEIPGEGNRYVPSAAELEAFAAARRIQEEIYGELPIQIGFCAGGNTKLTGLEYHQGSEVVVAATDCVHFLGRLQDIHDNSYHSGNARAFFQPKGTVVELYSTTLHYAPCKVSDVGYLTLVALPKGTNQPLEAGGSEGGNLLLTKKNKFLMVHETQTEKIALGVYPGLKGKLLEIKTM